MPHLGSIIGSFFLIAHSTDYPSSYLLASTDVEQYLPGLLALKFFMFFYRKALSCSTILARLPPAFAG